MARLQGIAASLADFDPVVGAGVASFRLGCLQLQQGAGMITKLLSAAAALAMLGAVASAPASAQILLKGGHISPKDSVDSFQRAICDT